MLGWWILREEEGVYVGGRLNGVLGKVDMGVVRGASVWVRVEGG